MELAIAVPAVTTHSDRDGHAIALSPTAVPAIDPTFGPNACDRQPGALEAGL
jgi:hypothetical protein